MNEISKKDLENITRIKLLPLKVKFDITTLDMVIAFIYKKSVLRTRKVCMNMYKLFTNLRDDLYDDSPELKVRIWIIKKSLEARLYQGWEDENRIAQFCRDSVDCDEYALEILDSLNDYRISHEESKYLVKKLDDTLQFGYIITVRDYFREIMDTIDEEDFKTYKAVQDRLFLIASTVMNIKRNAASLGSEHTFSLYQDQFDTVIEDCLQLLKDRNRIFLTGITRLNNILSPGYMSKRLYLYLAFPGKGKSTMLLKSALDIRKYNQGIKTKDPDKRPAVLFLTLENDIAETVERIFNMTVSTDDIRNYNSKMLIRELKKKGGLVLTEENNIDIIIKEYKNREIDTNDIYSIINDLADDGVEVVTLIVDYIKRLKPFEKAPDEKGELKNISNELKEIAKFYDIPVNSYGGFPIKFLEYFIKVIRSQVISFFINKRFNDYRNQCKGVE